MPMIDRRRLLAAFGGLAAAPFSAQRTSAAAAERIVMIHGCCHPDQTSDDIRTEWTAALTEGAAQAGIALSPGVEFVFPSYGNRLGDWVDRFDVQKTSDISAKGNAHQDDYLRFQLELAEEMISREGIPLSEAESFYDGDQAEKGPLNWEWVQAMLRVLESRNDRLAQSALDTFTRDVFLYLNNDAVRRSINGILRDHLDDRPTIVVAHSLGTVVAYDVLRSQALNVPLFVTLGSPLGIRTIRIRLTPIGFPQGVLRWMNFYDDRDPIALYPLDAENFGVSPAIDNTSDIDNDTSNRHGITGYLKDPRVARGILQ